MPYNTCEVCKIQKIILKQMKEYKNRRQLVQFEIGNEKVSKYIIKTI